MGWWPLTLQCFPALQKFWGNRKRLQTSQSGSNSFLNGLFEVDRVLALVCLGLVCVRRGDAGERALFLGVSLGLRRRLLDVKRLAFTRAISLF